MFHRTPSMIFHIARHIRTIVPIHGDVCHRDIQYPTINNPIDALLCFLPPLMYDPAYACTWKMSIGVAPCAKSISSAAHDTETKREVCSVGSEYEEAVNERKTSWCRSESTPESGEAVRQQKQLRSNSKSEDNSWFQAEAPIPHGIPSRGQRRACMPACSCESSIAGVDDNKDEMNLGNVRQGVRADYLRLVWTWWRRPRALPQLLEHEHNLNSAGLAERVQGRRGQEHSGASSQMENKNLPRNRVFTNAISHRAFTRKTPLSVRALHAPAPAVRAHPLARRARHAGVGGPPRAARAARGARRDAALALDDNRFSEVLSTGSAPARPPPSIRDAVPIWQLARLQLTPPARFSAGDAEQEEGPGRSVWLDLRDDACPIRAIVIRQSASSHRISDRTMARILEDAQGVPKVGLEFTSEWAEQVAAGVRLAWGIFEKKRHAVASQLFPDITAIPVLDG
ncbi:hypothetical protein BJ912DRAFT_1047664 [Pholiota molesta]|nr:hypothetical protein BJ912DRAFT_1047664 [Pholiota molesta]